MIVYRFAHPKFARDLSGTGARLIGGRWNPAGTPVTYTSEHISLALLEILANANSLQQLQTIQLVQIEVPDTASIHEVKLSGLKKEWYRDFDYTQWMGQEILRNSKTLLVKCPSAIVHSEHNFLINPLHADFKKIRLTHASGFYFDERLFRQPGASVSL
jgi:RES domain-containing protein